MISQAICAYTILTLVGLLIFNLMSVSKLPKLAKCTRTKQQRVFSHVTNTFSICVNKFTFQTKIPATRDGKTHINIIFQNC